MNYRPTSSTRLTWPLGSRQSGFVEQTGRSTQGLIHYPGPVIDWVLNHGGFFNGGTPPLKEGTPVSARGAPDDLAPARSSTQRSVMTKHVAASAGRAVRPRCRSLFEPLATWSWQPCGDHPQPTAAWGLFELDAGEVFGKLADVGDGADNAAVAAELFEGVGDDAQAVGV
jgi:hypothetical protein